MSTSVFDGKTTTTQSGLKFRLLDRPAWIEPPADELRSRILTHEQHLVLQGYVTEKTVSYTKGKLRHRMADVKKTTQRTIRLPAGSEVFFFSRDKKAPTTDQAICFVSNVWDEDCDREAQLTFYPKGLVRVRHYNPASFS
ncbi:MAG TPA: hypothetical protein VFG56_02585 [Candidatus Saccharimonadales bacterium]|nr:hypothetical protein [Candidatus Saccharimonadales bacterium]